MGLWDKTTPLDSDNASEGAERIRELKDALEEALSHEYSAFPGGSPSTAPIFIPGFLRGGTASRPTGDSLVEGRIYFNTDTNVIERYNGSTWDTIYAMPADGAIDTAQLAADCIDGTKIGDDVIDSEHYAAGSIDTEHLAADVIDGSKIADDAVDSEHLAAGGIDTEHLSASCVTTAKLNTATGSSSGAPGGGAYHTMNDYSFFPSLATWNSHGSMWTWTNGASDPGNTVGRFGYDNAQNFAFRWRYVTSSDNPRIWVLFDASNNIQAIWESEDPPNQEYPEDDTDPFEGAPTRTLRVPLIELEDINKMILELSPSQKNNSLKWLKRWVEKKNWKVKVKEAKHIEDVMEKIPQNKKDMGKLFKLRCVLPDLAPSTLIFNLMDYSPNDQRLVLKSDYADLIKTL